MSVLFQTHAAYLGSLFLIVHFLVVHCPCFLRAEDLLQPAPDMPAYTLSSISQVKDAFGRPVVTIDYTRTKEGIGLVSLTRSTVDGPLKIMGFGFLNEPTGKLQLSELFEKRTVDAELYLVVSGSFAEEVPFKCLVSNVVRVGNPSGDTAAGREWNSNESSAYQKELVGRKPPISPPDGFQLVRASTKLIPGMPIKVGRYGKWFDAEALSSDPIITVKIAGVEDLRTMKRDGWIAIEPAVLQKGVSDPGSFRASANVIPGTTEILAEDYVVLTEAMNLVPGTPVRAIWLNKLADATVIAADGQQVMTHYDNQASSFDKKLDRSALVISKETLVELSKPGAAEIFKDRIPKKTSPSDDGMDFQGSMDEQSKKIEVQSKRVQEMVERNLAAVDTSSPSAGAFDNPLPVHSWLLQNNPIELPIPKEAESVPLDFPLPRGTKLAVCWGRKWNYVTVLKDNREDTVPVHWDDRPPAFDGLIHRTQLIIRRSDLKKLRIKATREEKRVWTDTTGKHKVEATLLSRTSSQVTLIKEDGKEVTLPIDRLSQADQKWLKENP